VFDTIAGLPVHALVVHAVVVLLPLMALVTIAVAVRPGWRSRARLVVVVNVLVLGAALVARQSGLALFARVGQPGRYAILDRHVALGKVLWLFALGLVVAAGLTAASSRRPKLVPLAVVLSIAVALASIGWTFVTGDSGARSVWEPVIENSNR
jgi:hypothetical protein